jgi:hypothetical protein
MAEVGPWTFGWDALVAVGTLSLAAVTGGLAFLTWRLAAATAAEARSQARPALIPAQEYDDPRTLAPLEHRAASGELHVSIRNAGRGPALFVRVALEPTGDSPTSGPLAAMAAGDVVRLAFSVEARPPDRWQVLLDYRDLAGRTYSSAIVIESTPELRFYDVRTYEDRKVTPHGDALPQSGITDLTK